MHECYASRYWKVGGTYGVIIPPHVREQIGLRPGDLMLMITEGPLIIMRRAQKSMVLSAEQSASLPMPGPKVDVPSDGRI